jgi:hypothetical protein
MAIKDKDQPARDKPNESENQPQFASEDEARPERELGSSEDDDTEKVQTDSVLPGPNGRPGARAAAGASDPNEEAREALDDERRPPNADD